MILTVTESKGKGNNNDEGTKKNKLDWTTKKSDIKTSHKYMNIFFCIFDISSEDYINRSIIEWFSTKIFLFFGPRKIFIRE